MLIIDLGICSKKEAPPLLDGASIDLIDNGLET